MEGEEMEAVRRVLEEELGEGVAESVLFEALLEVAEEPETSAEVTDFAQGPLRDKLLAREGVDRTRHILRRLLDREEAADEPEPVASEPPDDYAEIIIDEQPWGRKSEKPDSKPPPVRSTFRPPPPAEPEPGTAPQPLKILVVARSKRVAFRIRASFGGHRVSLATADKLNSVRELLATFDPQLAVVDGEDAPEIAPDDIAAELGSDERLFLVVWGSDKFWGTAVTAALTRAEARFAPVPSDAGVEPLLDYVRARITAK